MTSKSILFLASSFLFTHQLAAAKPLEFSVGGERYQETYREYQNGDDRFMQQRGNLWSINGEVKYHLNEQHAVKFEGRYSKGKIDYIGGENPSDENPQGTPYGSVRQHNIERKSTDARVIYKYSRPLNEQFTLQLETGLGYRTLHDLSGKSDPEDYSRKNKTAYVHVGAGVDIKLPKSFELNPKIGYNRAIYGRQLSYLHNGTIVNKQRNGQGLEVDLPVSKTFGTHGKLSVGPFYRGWKVFDSDSATHFDDQTNEAFEAVEPKNYTHEAGIKVKYTF
ncbi:outer membrane beta-barrel protein [Neisseria arctica]|uniref:outer membrane beta-barrel protein n=1 Tax=Neisseria arctica TaxID=1470200 RepID=UPI00064B57D7|nr:outer membrane beta-barrel protein [Neisseria arctica]UOO85861.1 outer membrane beta-barrel protein [Neisseria arctica]